MLFRPFQPPVHDINLLSQLPQQTPQSCWLTSHNTLVQRYDSCQSQPSRWFEQADKFQISAGLINIFRVFFYYFYSLTAFPLYLSQSCKSICLNVSCRTNIGHKMYANTMQKTEQMFFHWTCVVFKLSVKQSPSKHPSSRPHSAAS